MKFSYQWLKEIVDIPVDAAALARELTMVGIQLESLKPLEDDAVLDFEVTVNRPDCLSILGLAREIAVIFGSPAPEVTGLQAAEILHGQKNDASYDSGGFPLRIVIEDPDLCPRYCGQIISNVKIGPSPAWMRNKLEACGLRSINNVVDLTNLVMLELGQPMHAFDYQKLAQATIRVRRAHDEPLLMIDGQERMLRDPMLAIADAERVVAVGGVMGGKESEVTDATTVLMLESAYFHPASVRKTARALEMSTDASYRFERGADYKMQAIACQRAATLLQKHAGATIHPILDVCPGRFASALIKLRPERVARILGERLDQGFMEGTLTALGFRKHPDDQWEVPSYRVDIFREIDLIEEIARHYGYNKFPNTLPKGEKKYQDDYPTYEMEHAVSEFLRAARMDEAFTYSFMNSASPYAGEEQRIKLINPIAENASELRTSLLPNLCESVEYNVRHRNQSVRLFEIGRVFLSNGEKISLGIALTGEYRDLKGVIEGMLRALGYAKPGIDQSKVQVGGKEIGFVRQLLIEEQEVQTCEIYLSDLIQLPKQELRYQSIIPYPFVERDVTFLIDEAVVYAQMETVLRDLNMPNLRSYRLIDRYKGPNTPAGKISVTFRLIYQSDSRTLTSEEVDQMHGKVIDSFASRFGAQLRS